MSQIIHPKDAEAEVAPTEETEILDLSGFVLGPPDDPKAILELLLNPPEFNEAHLCAQESYNKFFRKDS